VEEGDDLFGVVMNVDDDFLDAEGFEAIDGDFEEGAAIELDEGFGDVVGERAETGTEAGGEDHGFHGRTPRRPLAKDARGKREETEETLTRRR